MQRRVGFASLPEIHHHLFGSIDVKDKVVLPTPPSQFIHLLPISCLVALGDEPHHHGVVCKFHNEVVLIVCLAAVCQECVVQGAEDAALEGAGVKDDG